MIFSPNQIGLTNATVYDISAADLAGANSGQRRDLLAKTQAIFRTPDGKLYSANAARNQLVAAAVPITAATDLLTGGVLALVGPSGEQINGGAPTMTWAQIQALTGMAAGQRVNCSDFGYAQFIWDGTAWKAAGRIALVSQVTPVSKTDADTANQLAASFTVPAGLFSVGSALSFDFMAATNAVVAVNKNLTLTLGGVGVGTFQISTTSQSTKVMGTMLAASTSSVQTWWPGNAAVVGQSAGDNTATASINPTAQNTFALNLSWATAGSGTNTLTLRNFKLWLEP